MLPSSHPDTRLFVRSCAALLAAFMLVACEKKPEPAEPALSPAANQPSSPVTDAPEGDGEGRAVISDTLPYAEVDDELVYGHFAFPSDMVEPLPAVLLLHERWGLNDDIRELSDRLAAQGYIVLAADLFYGDTAGDVGQAAELMRRVVTDQEAAEENLEQALDFVLSTAGAPSLAVVGFGFGGGWALNAAHLFPGSLDAAVVYYGQVSDNPERLAPIKAPVLGFFGSNDKAVRLADVRSFESAMQDLDKTITLEVYEDATHGFASPSDRNYDAELTDRSWVVTLDFLRDALGDGS